ncbi:MAG TPA: hypothetical protein VFV71_06635 [Burkholderiales bacterium]|nr:hypothetical protein [Burkholderiales bacterium]
MIAALFVFQVFIAGAVAMALQIVPGLASGRALQGKPAPAFQLQPRGGNP